MINEPLKTELLEMRRRDLELREELVRAGALFNGYAERMADLHRRHNARLREILARHGWPGKSVVGPDGAEAAWLILQHAILDPDLMRSVLPLLEKAAREGEAEPCEVACLVDRIRTAEGKPQVYGTQHDWDEEGNLSPLPMEEPAHVDEKRRQVGLEPLAEHTRRLRARAEKEGDRPPRDWTQRQREIHQWARDVGWRE